MTSRFRSWVFVVAAGFLNPTMPAVAAMASDSAASATAMPCAGDMAPASPKEPCPCCPDGNMSIAGCLAACGATMGAVSTFELHPVPMFTVACASSEAVHLARVSDPPLKPPPIV